MKEKTDNVNIALNLIKNGELLVSNKTFFALKKGKIYCQNNNSNYSLNFEDFLKLYNGATFYLYENKDIIIDTLKDEEYYNWNVLKK